jgi:putative ABC transport system permease protein
MGTLFCLIAISFVIAVPIASYFMDKWLHLFQYNTGLTVSPYLAAALIVLVITLLTVTFHTMRAAMANPVRGLRTE